MDYTEVIVAAIGLFTAIVTTILAPAVKAWLTAKIGSEKLANAQRYVDIAVTAAEQVFTPEMWKDKKIYVENYLHTHGIDYDAETVDNMIESSVLRLHRAIKGGSAE